MIPTLSKMIIGSCSILTAIFWMMDFHAKSIGMLLVTIMFTALYFMEKTESAS